MFLVESMRRSYASALLVMAVSFSVTGCGTLNQGRGWGQDAIYPVDFKKVSRAAYRALLDPQTLIPAVGAIVFATTGYDRKVSDWATKHHPIFGSKETARDASNFMLIPLPMEVVVTALATPGSNDSKEWTSSKLKGLAVEGAAVLLADGVSWGLQKAINRTRPDGGSGSLPSLHASTAFSLSMLSNRNLESLPLSKEVRIPLQIGNVLLATSVAWARVEGGEHFPSDVLAGAALGNFFSGFIHDAFLGLPERKRFLVISPLKRGLMVQACFTLQPRAISQSKAIYLSFMPNSRQDR